MIFELLWQKTGRIDGPMIKNISPGPEKGAVKHLDMDGHDTVDESMKSESLKRASLDLIQLNR